jgi:hypothetical protein
MNEFTEILWRLESLLTMAAVWVLMSAAKKTIPKVMQNPLVIRLLPLVPIALCSGAVWIPGLAPAGIEAGPRIMLGVVLGAGAGQAHKILKQTGLGRDPAIEEKKDG